jgi:hypothetical protein
VANPCLAQAPLAPPSSGGRGCRTRIASARLKNDKVDAAILGQLLRADLLPEAWIAPPAIRQLRALLRHRVHLVRLRTRLRNRIHAIVAGDISRFASARKLASWAGLTPTVRGSDRVAHYGHISKERPGMAALGAVRGGADRQALPGVRARFPAHRETAGEEDRHHRRRALAGHPRLAPAHRRRARRSPATRRAPGSGAVTPPEGSHGPG